MLRQYMNDLPNPKNQPVLKLPRFSFAYTVREKARQFQNQSIFGVPFVLIFSKLQLAPKKKQRNNHPGEFFYCLNILSSIKQNKIQPQQLEQREHEKQQNSRPFRSSMAERQLFGFLDIWQSSCKQNPCLRFPISVFLKTSDFLLPYQSSEKYRKQKLPCCAKSFFIKISGYKREKNIIVNKSCHCGSLFH